SLNQPAKLRVRKARLPQPLKRDCAVGDERNLDFRLAPAAIDLDIEVANLLAQGVAVQPEQVGGPDLVAAGRSEGCGKQRNLDLLEDAVIEARRRDAVGKALEVRGEIGLYGTA